MSAEAASRTSYRPQTAADALGARLRARLHEGRFRPGEAISIRRISEIEGTSVIPARDALRGLVAEGALEFRDSRTIVVPELDPGTIGELRYARITLEGELASRAFSALADRGDDLRRIDVQVTQALRARDVPAYMSSNRALHFEIYAAAQAPVLLALAETLWLRWAPSMRIVCDAFGGQLPQSDYHLAAIAALVAGDAAGFRSAIEADIGQGMDMLVHHQGDTGS